MLERCRQVYCVFGGSALRYARTCLLSMLRNSVDPLRLTVITDGPDDVAQITLAFADEVAAGKVRLFTRRDADERAAAYYGGLDGIAWFRQGHPCWLKITDPPLFADEGEEMILVDPDVYFPNRFRFERTPPRGVLLMWQKPNCLFPPASVRAAFRAGYAMADHTDIGIAQLVQPVDKEWLNTFIERVGRTNLPTWSMHIESIVWAAWAVQAGGGYLDPRVWKCWYNAHWKRCALKLGMAKWRAVANEPFERIACFHATGPAKDMLMELLALRPAVEARPPTAATQSIPYRLYPRAKFEAAWAVKVPLLEALGVMNSVVKRLLPARQGTSITSM